MHYNQLCTYIYSISNDKLLAEDVVQNVMVKIWRNRRKIQIKSSLKKYLYRSCYNELVDVYKKNKKEFNYIQQVQKEALEVFENMEEEFLQDKLNHLKKAIEQLPPKCKEVFELNKLQGYGYRESSEMLGISIKTVENQISKAMKTIRNQLGEL